MPRQASFGSSKWSSASRRRRQLLEEGKQNSSTRSAKRSINER